MKESEIRDIMGETFSTAVLSEPLVELARFYFPEDSLSKCLIPKPSQPPSVVLFPHPLLPTSSNRLTVTLLKFAIIKSRKTARHITYKENVFGGPPFTILRLQAFSDCV